MMPGRRLLWQLYPSYLLVILLCTLAVAAFSLRSVEAFHLEQVKADLAAKCRLIERQAGEYVAPDRRQALQQLTDDLSERAHVRITVIALDGTVLSDSDKGARTMANHATRPEVVRALAGQVGQSVRYSRTLRTDMVYVAVPVRGPGGITAVVRTASPMTDVYAALSALSKRIWIVGLLVAALAAAISMLVSRRVSRSLGEVADAAEQFAEGDLAHSVPLLGTLELDRLAVSLNRMAARLGGQIDAISRRSKEHEAVLASMAEGVLSVDHRQRVIGMNNAAARMLDADAEQARGRALQEVTRNVLLERFVAGVLSGRAPAEAEIVLHDGADRQVRLRGEVLHDADERDMGALIVMSDLTRMRRLENVRRDFVAAVSHELRTPVTAIQGFVETLRDGAVSDPQRAAKFLDILSRQAERLGNIIEDLLALSRVDQDVEARAIDFVRSPVRDVLCAAVADCNLAAAERNVSVGVDCDAGVTARMRAQLIEQALVNLLDNAIKYSPAGSRVVVEARSAGGSTVIRVRDQGCGIAPEHLSRIFESFYCVDKSHSRTMGGTGLGLAIVKHIVQAHGGRVTVESTVGEGSVFCLHLPA